MTSAPRPLTLGRLLHNPGLWLALLTLAVYLAAWNTGTEQLHQLSLLLLATLIAGYLLPRFNVRGVRVERQIPAEMMEGDRVEIELSLRSAGWLARYLLQIRDQLPFLDQPDYPVLIARLWRTRRFSYPVICERRGIHRLGPLRVRSDFPLALLSVEQTLPDSAVQITVLPRPFPLRRLALSGRSGFPTDGHQVGAVSRGHDSFAGIREYRRGDSMRHIHWRASARRGEWIVREYEQVENCELVLVLNSHRQDNLGEGRESCFEYAVRIAASIARYATENGHKVGLFCQQAGVLHWLAPDSAGTHYRYLLEHLAAVQADHAASYASQIEQAALLVGRQARLVLFHTLTTLDGVPASVAARRRDLPPLEVCFDGASFSGGARLAGLTRGADPNRYWVRAGDDLTEVFER